MDFVVWRSQCDDLAAICSGRCSIGAVLEHSSDLEQLAACSMHVLPVGEPRHNLCIQDDIFNTHNLPPDVVEKRHKKSREKLRKPFLTPSAYVKSTSSRSEIPSSSICRSSSPSSSRSSEMSTPSLVSSTVMVSTASSGTSLRSIRSPSSLL